MNFVRLSLSKPELLNLSFITLRQAQGDSNESPGNYFVMLSLSKHELRSRNSPNLPHVTPSAGSG